MDDAPLLSIISISHQDPDGLTATIASLSGQYAAHQNSVQWLFVLGDAPSVDIAGADIIHTPPNGIYDAMNIGLHHARGQYVWFLSGGDMATPDILGRLCLELKQGPDILYGDAIEQDIKPWRKPAKNLSALIFGMITHHPAIIAKRSIISGFDTHFTIAADYHWLLGCWRQNAHFYYWPEAIAQVARGGQSEQYAAQGRAEQTQIRHQILGWPMLICHFYAALQRISPLIRRTCPIFWRYGRGVLGRFAKHKRPAPPHDRNRPDHQASPTAKHNHR